MDNDEIIKEETEYIKDIKDIDNIKLNYDYHSYENIINTNQQLKQLIPSKSKKEYNLTINSNILLNNKQNELKRNSLTEISNIKNKDINIINNNNNENKKYIQTTRNNNNKISYNLLNLNKINNDYKNIITQKESLEKKLYLNDLMNEESKDYETLELITKKSNNKKNNKKTDNYIITNDNIDIDVEEEESKEYSNNENKVLKNYKSNPQLNTVRDNYSNVNKCANFIMQNKYDELYKEYFNMKTKYEISKTNMNILQKKLKQKNEYISQLKKILISNKHQISFLISLKDSNAKSLKDNETLINNLKLTIANLNTKIIELKNKLSQKIQSNLTNDEIKVENDTLKIYLNDRDKTISTLKNSLSFLTQNLDSILHITENDKKLNEYNIEKLEKYLINMKELNENINKKNKEIIDIKNDNEQLKKNIEDKNIQIKDLNIIIEQKNKEINDMQKLILEKNNNNFSKELKVIKQSSFALYHKIKNNENKIVIKKIKKNQSESKNKNHFNKEKLFKNNKFRIKTNFDYFNDNDDDFIENEPKKTMKSLYNINYRKNKSNKNFNTIIGNNFFINRTTTTNLNNIESKIDTERTLKLHLYNTNDDDLKKNHSIKPYNKNNKIKKQKSNLILSTSTISLSQNENIKSITYPEKSASNFDFIYSLVNNSDLICFNLKQKKFDIRKINDNTKGIYTSYISYYRQNKLQPLLLNNQKYFYILMQKYIFYYDSSLNCINILTKAFSNHLNGKFIQIENSLYLISGNKNTQCELYSLIIKENKLLPSTNYPRINSGVCNINDEYIYIFFGQFCQNSIERLNIKNLNYDEKWEIIQINEFNAINDNNIYLNKFITFLDDYNNVIIFGGEDYNNEKSNKNIYGFNLYEKSLAIIGKIDSSAKYCNQYIKLDESIFAVFDENNGLHFFSKELDYHEIFNLNL